MSQSQSQSNLEDLQSLSLDKGARPRRRKRWPGKLIAGCLALLVVGYAAKRILEKRAEAAVVTAKAIRVSPIAEFEITTANGYVIPRRRAAVASKTMGRLKAVLVDEGDAVKEGQLLAEVEHAEEDAAVASAVAAVANARAVETSLGAELEASKAAARTARATLAERKAALDESRAILEERKSTYARTLEMKGQGITSDAQLDTARMQRDVADAQVKAADTAVGSADQVVLQQEANVAASQARLSAQRTMIEAGEAQLTQARATRENAFIKAPFSGLVLRREAEPGEVVSPANTGASGSKTAVVSMADFTTLEVEVDVYERDIARIQSDTKSRIVLDAYPDRLLVGNVRLVRPTADRSKATIKVNVSFERVPEFARPEMGARVTFLLSGADALAHDRVEVPDAAVLTRSGKRGVEIVQGEERTFREVEFGASTAGKTLVVKGLSGGETLALKAQ